MMALMSCLVMVGVATAIVGIAVRLTRSRATKSAAASGNTWST